ncbi:MAG: hypothetical protein SVR08_02040 [Spirochaetota bacterium]|nr:hypothetical protein [Spirochaetota bacterium]
MSKDKFTTKRFLSQFKQCPQLAYDFTDEQILGEVNRFLTFIGYEMSEPPNASKLKEKPAFYGKRVTEKGTFVVTGTLIRDMNEGDEGVQRLDKLKEELGDDIDYIMAVSPCNERYLIDYMCKDNYASYKYIMEKKYMLWLCNADEKSVWCCFGAPQDKIIQEYFKFEGGIDKLFHMPYRKEAKQLRKDFWKDDV